MESGTAIEDGAAEEALLDKERSLLEWLAARGSVLIGFSGGVDSTYLACVATEALGSERALAVIGRSASYPAAQWQAARDVAARFGINVFEVDTSELEDAHYTANPTNRCYFCKRELWSRLEPVARAHGLDTIVDGTNADDLADYRPGAAAAREHGVRSPLAQLSFSKRDIRELSRRRGIPTWAQPSAPCLSSRVPYGTAITPARLQRVEAAEAALRVLGVEGDLRVRYHGDLARVELDAGMLDRWLAPRASADVHDAVTRAGFSRVAIDLRGFRSGSLNVLGGVVAERPTSQAPNVHGERGAGAPTE